MSGYKKLGDMCGYNSRETFTVNTLNTPKAHTPKALTLKTTPVPKGIIDINSKSQIDDLIKNSNILVLKIYADWCGPCKKFAPLYKKLANESNNGVNYCQLNLDTNIMPDVQGVPTTHVYKNGVLSEQVTGGSIDKLKAAIVKTKTR